MDDSSQFFFLVAQAMSILASAGIVLSRSYGTALTILVSVSLFNIPVFLLGNTSSAGIFPADFACMAFLVRYFVLSNRSLLSGVSKPEVGLLLALTGYAVLRGALGILGDEYDSYYSRFVVYGMARWVYFFVILLISSQNMTEREMEIALKRLAVVLLLYYGAAIPNQFGLLDLSGLAATGYERVYDTENISDIASRAFLGNNSASVGCVSAIGIFLGFFLVRQRLRLRGSLLMCFSCLALLGSGSRSDVVATIGALAWVFLSARNRGARRALLYQIGLICLLVVCLAVIGTAAFPHGLQRLLDTDFFGEATGSQSGSLSDRISNWWIAIDYLIDDVWSLCFGLGPNAYRMLSIGGVGTLNFGHNLLVHTLGELGLIGSMLLCLLLAAFIKSLRSIQRSQNFLGSDIATLTLLVVVQRIVCGFGVDSLFATDNMVTMNTWTLFVVGVSLGLQWRIQRHTQVTLDAFSYGRQHHDLAAIQH